MGELRPLLLIFILFKQRIRFWKVFLVVEWISNNKQIKYKSKLNLISVLSKPDSFPTHFRSIRILSLASPRYHRLNKSFPRFQFPFRSSILTHFTRFHLQGEALASISLCRLTLFYLLAQDPRRNWAELAMQNQLVCSGCRSVLLYPRGATNVCCALCSTITSVPPPGMEMAQLICGGCRTLLMYTRGATSVRCSCCHTVNLAPASNQVAHVNCGNCRTTLMYPYGAPSVKCAVCHFVTNVGTANVRVPIPVHRPNGTTNPGTIPSTSTNQTVVVENPMSVDESGKLVSNVVVGVTTDKK